MISVRTGEKVAVYGTASVSTGTLTISGATFDLLDNQKNVIPGASGIAATGQDAPGASVRAWYVLDTLHPPTTAGTPLPRGLYWIKWNLPISGTSDGINRTERPDVTVLINDV